MVYFNLKYFIFSCSFSLIPRFELVEPDSAINFIGKSRRARCLELVNQLKLIIYII